jgi:mono/diheme cytochrome c family protein
VPQNVRDQAVSDPRALLWRADGQRGWVAGLGSNNVVPLNANGTRAGAPIAVGQGPAGLALDPARARLYVWNHFDATLSVIDANAGTELARVAAFNPLPQAIRAGRPLLYDTHRTSGLGQAACASCHVDARNDRLAWDLGDPAAPPQPFDQNCGTTIAQVAPCQPFQGMKGPMTTQTLVDIIGHEPFHWRGDRAGIEAFNPAFQGLLGDDTQLTPAEMQAFEDFLDTLTFPPNPYRNFDNSLPPALALEGQYTSGRFALPGLPLGTGNAVRGLELYTRGVLDTPFQCASCHTLPTGMAVNGPLFIGTGFFSTGGSLMPLGPHGENHLGIVSVDGSTNVSIKVPHLRNEYQKTGFYLTRTDSTSGFGILHDGSVDTLPRFMSARAFSVTSDQDVADLVALMLAFTGSDFGPIANPVLGAPPPLSRDAHAAVGAQLTLSGGAVPQRAAEMLALAQAGAVELVVHAGSAGWFYDNVTQSFATSDGSAPLSSAALLALASAAQPQTWTVVPRALGRRLGIDRDGDGVGDAAELRQGSNPADAASKTLRPSTGLWYDPNRSGHGFDVQLAGTAMFATWYTYDDDGTPTWYQAVGDFANPWVATMNRFTWNPATGKVVIEPVGELKMTFDSAQSSTVDWRIGTRTGTEPIQRLLGGTGVALPITAALGTTRRNPAGA